MVGHGGHAPEERFGVRVAPPPRSGRKTPRGAPLHLERCSGGRIVFVFGMKPRSGFPARRRLAYAYSPQFMCISPGEFLTYGEFLT
eukprot:2996261-Prymnesium_polylepis.1